MIEALQAARSIEPNGLAPVGSRHVAIVASRMAACVSRPDARSGTAAMAASTPTFGSAAIASMARSVCSMNRAIPSAFESSVLTPAISPGPGSGTIRSTCSTTACSPPRSSWTGSLLAKPVAASTASCWTATPWPKSGYSTIVTSSGVSWTEPSSAWSMIHEEPYLPGMPIFFPARPAASVMPDEVFANTIEGYVP